MLTRLHSTAELLPRAKPWQTLLSGANHIFSWLLGANSSNQLAIHSRRLTTLNIVCLSGFRCELSTISCQQALILLQSQILNHLLDDVGVDLFPFQQVTLQHGVVAGSVDQAGNTFGIVENLLESV
jgi:hypothetical protein